MKGYCSFSDKKRIFTGEKEKVFGVFLLSDILFMKNKVFFRC
ncbi:hypothetical protein BD94_3989 [Elizabethkingia anophelis NUHP1]|uniref:Uncharacterized protein n=1 Tax=Elizabethkingia anophelis NUHP1 TaxID=1338011 RepID=A0A077ENH9_9FLAO|nr:hypothetical protein BD94_3989 [Elizabethkingia anophelis NUHP1]KMU63300.1 hypothetical protein EZBTHKR_1783 [Elizabethkingia anophelis]